MDLLFSWLHVSDIHFGHGSAGHSIDQRLILSALTEDAVRLMGRGVPRPSALFITGDIAHSGGLGKASSGDSEYSAADQWIRRTMQRLHIEHDAVFLVPGNHDVQRDMIADRNLARLVEQLRSGRESLDDALADSRDVALLASRFSNYSAFASGLGAPPDVFWTRRIVRPSFEIEVVGVNTAMLAQDAHDRGRLRVGLTQLGLSDDTLTPRFFLGHHPFEWLGDRSVIEGWIRSKGDVYLCGHDHRSESSQLVSGGGTELLTIVAGAAHRSESEPPEHGYAHGALYRDSDGTMLVRIWPRRWSSDHKAYRLNADSVPDGREYSDHPIRQSDPADLTAEISSGEATVERPSGAPHSIAVQVRATPSQCDPPPKNPAWVGRQAELGLLGARDLSVVAIVGIGGQGKSALASHYTYATASSSEYASWDWRDCKEQVDTLQTHLLRIIERVSDGRVRSTAIRDEPPSVVSRIFFDVLGSARWLFVFDNVDQYVDVDTQRPTAWLGDLIQAALTRPHNAKIIVTCRPHIAYDNPSFFALSLAGLSIADATELFRLRGVDAGDSHTQRSIAAAVDLTKGHPLWLNLIATQVSKNRASIGDLVKALQRGGATPLPAVMLRSIWNSLNGKQRDLLRCMAEVLRPETEDQLSRLVDPVLRWNQFNRAIRSLRLLDLVVVKQTTEGGEVLELHPVVREFIRREFPRAERRRYIGPIARVLDTIIATFQGARRQDVPFSDLDTWMMRAELAINAGDFEDAMRIAHDASRPMLEAGYPSAFVRVATRLYSEMDWSDAVLREYKHFDELFADYIKVLAEAGRFEESDRWLLKYENSIAGRGARYINLCNLRAYAFWLRDDHQSAKDWAARGDDLKRSGIDTRFDCAHHLALARRDGGEVDTALAYFLSGESLGKVLAGEIEEAKKTGQYFGNIGRCLWLQGNLEGALSCYRQSARLLETSSEKTDPMNRGWARLWIAEVLKQKGAYRDAYLFFRAAALKWKDISPARADAANEEAEQLRDRHADLNALAGADETRIEGYCRSWLDS